MLLVVGGHSRNIGKSSVVAGLIEALPEARWTAIKITQFGHGVCAEDGEECSCSDLDHPFAIDEEREPGRTDTGRFLAAGAERSLWVRTPVGQLGLAIPELRRIVAQVGNVIVESNSLLDFFVPDLYVIVVDYRVADVKDSARRFWNRADAIVETSARPEKLPWEGIPDRWLDGAPRFEAKPPEWVSPELALFVREAGLKSRAG
ncbi:MAG: hypothetical protein U0Q16_25545 [Bryobacteraceae bacterium]